MPASDGWKLARGRRLDLDRPRVMAVVNLTSDSFYTGSRAEDAPAALEAASRAAAECADMLDLGAESTRPGALPIAAADQIARLVPAIEAIRGAGGTLGEIPISVDTTSAEVARRCVDAGADAVNDVSAGQDDPGMLTLAATSGAGLVLMHRRALPRADRYSDQYPSPPRYADVVETVRAFLLGRVEEAMRAGVAAPAIVIDPGLGFGKGVEDNLRLVSGIGRLVETGYPVLGALSRKSFVGRVSLNRESDPGERLAGTLALNLDLVRNGVRLLRVHDVGAHVQALRALACLGAAPPRETPGGSERAPRDRDG